MCCSQLTAISPSPAHSPGARQSLTQFLQVLMGLVVGGDRRDVFHELGFLLQLFSRLLSQQVSFAHAHSTRSFWRTFLVCTQGLTQWLRGLQLDHSTPGSLSLPEAGSDTQTSRVLLHSLYFLSQLIPECRRVPCIQNTRPRPMQKQE